MPAASSFFGSKEALSMCYVFKTVIIQFLTHLAINHAGIPFCFCGLKLLVLSSSNFWSSPTSLHFGWHAHPGNRSAGKSNHTTTIPETCADCLKIVIGLTESMGETGRCAAHKSTNKPRPCGHTNKQMCCSQKAPASQARVATKNKKLLMNKPDTKTGQENSNA